MSKTTILRPGSCFWRFDAVELIFLLNCWASLLILETHPGSWYPNKVRAAGRQPRGGSEVTPSFLAPKPYKSCLSHRPQTSVYLLFLKLFMVFQLSTTYLVIEFHFACSAELEENLETI